MVSVDGFRLALRREPLERIDGGAFRFVAPGSALNEVEKICEDSDDLMTIIQGKRHLMFETGSTQLICRRLEGEFLDYRNAIPPKQSHLHSGGYQGHAQQSGPCQRGHQ